MGGCKLGDGGGSSLAKSGMEDACGRDRDALFLRVLTASGIGFLSFLPGTGGADLRSNLEGGRGKVLLAGGNGGGAFFVLVTGARSSICIHVTRK